MFSNEENAFIHLSTLLYDGGFQTQIIDKLLMKYKRFDWKNQMTLISFRKTLIWPLLSLKLYMISAYKECNVISLNGYFWIQMFRHMICSILFF